jgi:hypothetical protein
MAGTNVMMMLVYTLVTRDAVMAATVGVYNAVQCGEAYDRYIQESSTKSRGRANGFIRNRMHTALGVFLPGQTLVGESAHGVRAALLLAPHRGQKQSWCRYGENASAWAMLQSI